MSLKEDLKVGESEGSTGVGVSTAVDGMPTLGNKRLRPSGTSAEEPAETKLARVDTAPPVAPIVGSDTDWSALFQEVSGGIQALHSNSSLEDQRTAQQRLVNLSEDFRSTAEAVARTIISEVGLPTEEKTLKPDEMGGQLGGQKFISQGIVFKLAVANKIGKYQMQRAQSSKVSGHELRSLVQLYQCREPNLIFPMTVLVDFCGFRVLGIAKLPIGEKTLVHGTPNGTFEGLKYSPMVNERMKALASKLNLGTHLVGVNEGDKHPTTNLKEFHFPIDLEVHCPSGFEGKELKRETPLVLLDFSRTFPPSEPPPETLDHLFKLLRPEFLRSYKPEPLVSDAHTQFIYKVKTDPFSVNAKGRIDDAVTSATDYLRSTLLPRLARELGDMKIPESERSDFDLVNFLHFRGVNLRYLGGLYKYYHARNTAEYTWAKLLVLIEMSSRSIKDYLREELSGLIEHRNGEKKPTKDMDCRVKVASIFNQVFGESQESRGFREINLERIREKYFTDPLFHAVPVEDLRLHLNEVFDGTGRWTVLQRVTTAMGFEFAANSSWKNYSHAQFASDSPFVADDLSPMKPKTKEMDIVGVAHGFVNKMDAISTINVDRCRSLLERALHSYHSALEINPTNLVALCNLAETYLLLDMNAKAKRTFQDALSVGKVDQPLFSSTSASETLEKLQNL